MPEKIIIKLLILYTYILFINKSIYLSFIIEGLFKLIVEFNLDYPDFFDSLYRLMNPSIFSAKYRAKFFNLLTKSLKSTNISAYMAASFIKRFAQISIFGPSPTAIFCISQIASMIRSHPQVVSVINIYHY